MSIEPWESNDILKVIYKEHEIKQRIQDMGLFLTRYYEKCKKPIIAMCVLNGGCVFFADLIREINLPVAVDFIKAESYGDELSTSGHVNIVVDNQIKDISDKKIILIDDVVDSGLTTMLLRDHLMAKGADVDIVCCVSKLARRRMIVPILSHGFVLHSDTFLVGYGLNYKDHYRNMPYIGELKPEVYQDS